MFYKTLSGTLLIAGTTIGAGMLGIPLLTARAGFLPAIGITMAVWLFMLATGYLYLEATLWMHQEANVLSMSRRFLGRTGKWFAGGIYLFLYYCLMIAYYAAGAPIFMAFINQMLGTSLAGGWGYLIYGLVFGGIVLLGLKVIDRINYLLMAAMFVSYFALVGVGSSILSFEHFGYANWSEMVFAAPILFSAFGYHNVIPSLVSYFDRNVKVIRRAIFFGTLVPLLIFIVWQGLILGAVPLSAIEETLASGQPVTQALYALTRSPWVVQMGQFFAFFAIITSMLGVAFSMVDFLGDGCGVRRTGVVRMLLCLATFVPPFLFASLDPTIFVTALGFAGGFGEVFLNGLLPIGMVWVGRYHRKLEGAPQLFGDKIFLQVLFALGISVTILEIIFLFRTN